MSSARFEHAGLFIGGRWLPTDETRPVIDPATEQVVVETPWGGKVEALAAVTAARESFDRGTWSGLSPRERAAGLSRFRDAIAARADDVVARVVAEVGIPVTIARVSQFDIPMQLIDFFIERTARFDAVRPTPPNLFPNRQGGTTLSAGVVVREPRGVVTAITPFNAPFFVNAMKVFPALGAGCSVILKPSDLTPLQSLVLAEAAEEAGLPPGVFNVVTGGPDVGEILTTDDRVDMVSVTGSEAVGALVMAQASSTIKHVVLELGGKSALIVREDANIADAAKKGATEITTFTGQGCALRTRHLVHRSRYEEYLATTTAVLGHMTIGAPGDPATIVGPLISERQRARTEDYVASAVADGARLVVGGKRPEGFDRGFYYEPTLFADVTNDMRIAQEEVFGPVGVVIPFDTDDEAVAIANDSPFGLYGSIYSGDPAVAYEMAMRLRVGAVTINGGAGGMSPWAPFGGYKRSGLGRELGADALEEFTEVKSIQFPAG
ncbi:MAG: aldehyde dehydrogenase [Aeromicrobium sp.]|nr:aldehyde dehydrogenase [Aeromicrobium sp.]